MSRKTISNNESAVQAALRMLVQREYFAAELRSRLNASYPESEVMETMVRLSDWGFVDDTRQGVHLRESLTQKRYGSEKVRWELTKRGVPGEVIEWILVQESEVEEVELAREAAHKKFAQGESAVKVARYLMGRGFSEEAVREVVESGFSHPDLES